MSTLIITAEDFTPLRKIPLEGRDCLTIGRSTQRDLIVNDLYVSRLQCVLYREGAMWCIADCGSSGGTRVDGQRVLWKRLRPGRQAQIGRLRLWVESGEEVGHGAPARESSGISETSSDVLHQIDLRKLETAAPAPAEDPSGKTSVFLDSAGDFLPAEDSEGRPQATRQFG